MIVIDYFDTKVKNVSQFKSEFFKGNLASVGHWIDYYFCNYLGETYNGILLEGNKKKST
jgi:hypothetical protein